jgi:hypothetical protein
MRMMSFGLGLLAALALALGNGCKKSGSDAGNGPSGSQQSTTNQPLPISLARVHWLGKNRIAGQKTAKLLMSIWNTPEAARLEAQTLDKLALALTGEQPLAGSRQLTLVNGQMAAVSDRSPVISTQALAPAAQPAASKPAPTAAMQPRGESDSMNQAAQDTNLLSAPANQPPVSLLSAVNHPLSTKLRPLLEDLVKRECYLEVRQAANPQGEVIVAVRLDDSRAELWTSNLTTVLVAFTNARPLPAPASRSAWQVVLPPRSPSRLDLARVGEWILIGLAAETNRLLGELSHRILTDHTPVPTAANSAGMRFDPTTRKLRTPPGSSAADEAWLDADFDLQRVSGALLLGWKLSKSWPRISTTWTGTGEYVRTTGTLAFANPLNIQLEPWNIPTNLIHDPLTGFSAVRGIRSWLAGQKLFRQLQIEPVPNQFCTWASGPTPLLTYAAMPATNAAALIQRIGPQSAVAANAWMNTNAMGEVVYSNQPPGLTWAGIPMFAPEIEARTTPGGDFVVGTLGARFSTTGKPAPSELFAQLNTRSNLVFYDWEITPAKLHQWIYLSQTARLALVLPQLPSDSAAFAFLRRAAPRLATTGTEVIQDGPTHLSFIRNSQLGFTGVELHLLADWLESPTFPNGFHSLLGPRPAIKYLRPPKNRPVSNAQAQTNAVAPRQ